MADFKNVESKISKYLKERGWDDLRPSDLAKSIIIESAELLELFQWQSMTVEDVMADKEKLEEIKKELADVMIYSLELSIALGLNTEKIILDKLKLASEKYPAKLMLEDKNKERGTERNYLDIKKKHRQNKNGK